MARGRMLNNKVSRSLQFDQLPDDTCRLMATWIISHLDVNGVFHGDPVMVRSVVFPRRVDVSAEQIEGYLQAMEGVGLIVRYFADGELWQWWPGFRDNQVGLRVDRETPEYPPPPDGLPQGDGDLPRDGGEARESGGNDDAELAAQGEVEVEDEIERDGANASPSPPPKPKRARQKKPTPEAVKVFRENVHRYPAKSWYDAVETVVGDDPDDLKRWGELCHEWVGRGYNPVNVSGMLDCYQGGGLDNGKGKPNGTDEPSGSVFSNVTDAQRDAKLARLAGGAGADP